MINENRVVPVSKSDLLSLYAVMLGIANVNVTKLDANDAEGNFSAGTGTKICSEPLKSLNFTGASGTIYFVAAYDYEGFSVSGTKVATATVTAPEQDAATLYKAVLSSGTVTVTKVGV